LGLGTQSVVVHQIGIQREGWKPSIVPSQKVIPEGSTGGLEIPEKVASIGRHLKEGKVEHPVLLFDGGIWLASSKDGVRLVSNRPFSNNGGKSLVGNLLLECSAGNLSMGIKRCGSETLVKAMIDVDVHDDILVSVGIGHETIEFVLLEGMIHDDGVSGGGKMSSDSWIQLDVEVLDESNSSSD